MQWKWKWLRTGGKPTLLVILSLLLFLSVVVDDAFARPNRNGGRRGRQQHARNERRDAETPRPGAGSLSVGKTTRGRLINGVALRESESLKWRSGGVDNRFGTTEMVDTLHRAANQVERTIPGAKLTIGDISRRNGGRFRPHRSHRNGRDVDISFYWLDADGNPAYPDRFIDAHADGTSELGRGVETPLRFDDARNWELVSALVSDPAARVQYMFVSRNVKARVMAEGRRRGAPEELLLRVDTVLHQPSRGGAHRDHFHMRIYCAEDDRPRCLDAAPYHAWLLPAPSPQLHAGLSPLSPR